MKSSSSRRDVLAGGLAVTGLVVIAGQALDALTGDLGKAVRRRALGGEASEDRRASPHQIARHRTIGMHCDGKANVCIQASMPE